MIETFEIEKLRRRSFLWAGRAGHMLVLLALLSIYARIEGKLMSAAVALVVAGR